MQSKFECDHCDALFTVKWDMDEHFYEIMFCPFCGGEITKETEAEDIE